MDHSYKEPGNTTQLSWQQVQDIFHSKQLLSLDFESVMRSFAEGKSYQEMLGIPDILMDTFTTIANEYLDNRQYKEAGDCFFFLASLNPFESEYWLRLGNAEHATANFEDSVHAYSMAAWTDADDPFPHFYLAQVYYALGNNREAEHCLETSFLLLDEAPELKEARPLLEGLKRKMSKEKSRKKRKI